MTKHEEAEDPSKVTLHAQLDTDVYEALRLASESEERTIAGQVRLILRVWYENQKLVGDRRG